MLRRRLANTAAGAGQAAAELAPVELLARCRVVGGYHPLGSEIDPRPLLQRFEAAGAQLALPVVVGAKAPLEFRAVDPAHVQEDDALGMPAPPAHARRVRPELLIVPLLAFDRSGGRLGQGGGYYDRTLAHLDADGGVFALGLAFSAQEVAVVPVEEHDRRLDAILTEREYVPVSEGG
jgi:5-formyltetrahydrofolate cyclo-ligase